MLSLILLGLLAAGDTPQPWTVSRGDYVEFCRANQTTIDLATGKVSVEIGQCDPNRNAPPKEETAVIAADMLDQLRDLSIKVLKEKALYEACAKGPGTIRMVQTLPGPSGMTIVQGKKTFSMSLYQQPCITPTELALARKFSEALQTLNIPRMPR